MAIGLFSCVVSLICWLPLQDDRGVVRIPLNRASEVDISEIVTRLAETTGLRVDRPATALLLPLEGRAASLTRSWLADTLGSAASLVVDGGVLQLTLDTRLNDPILKSDWERRVRELAERTNREIRRRERYGFRSRESFRSNDPSRPTVCLIHGLNSTSGVFRHLFEPLEAAGYGLVTYEFPYNRDLDETSAAFTREWAEFRKRTGDERPWSIVAHSMGALLARSYVEDDRAFAGDVGSMILIAPPNHGSTLARSQTLLQLVQGARAVKGETRSDPLAVLGDGVGLAADDLTPGSEYLRLLNARRRPLRVRYHILAGDVAYLSAESRRQIERGPGLLGGMGRFLAGGMSASLDELTDGLGDGCVSVASTRLEGVEDHRVLHANHLELIRAPLLFPEPGPVASMPDLLRSLREDAEIHPGRR
jgi:pimeloyl-ACP methyl ester carboxylesterase